MVVPGQVILWYFGDPIADTEQENFVIRRYICCIAADVGGQTAGDGCRQARPGVAGGDQTAQSWPAGCPADSRAAEQGRQAADCKSSLGCGVVWF